ncbi:hypothetical protein ACFQ1M_01980 [Sungkyunkwania multivorans]|uniref:Periplasmic heavy metal sensor n=1 Tax=Sungkyunkwania multivorans TaxID=1173618 RepID=A0ABW3CV71_9FLAO
MKKVILVGLLVAGSSLFAQQVGRNGPERMAVHEDVRQPHHHKKFLDNLTPEQAANLKTKRMVLDLELSDEQEKKVFKLNEERIIQKRKRAEDAKDRRDAEKQLNDAEVYERLMQNLNSDIAYQGAMRDILKEGQYELWKEKWNRRKARIQKKRRSYRAKK